MRFRNLIVALGMGLALTACADLFTINRETEIPDRLIKQPGKAIHLDAQQRLFVATARGYCAEPNPDALASYATALGFDLDVFGKNPASVAQALKNDAASIGLRTQSITLMRDVLYRMCEASNNDRLDSTEVAAFLRRSQDLIAVVLAIEQLTGAVAANQVILTPSAKSNSPANLVSNQQLLDQMEKNIQEKEKAVEDARSNLPTAAAESSESDAVETANTKLKAAQERLENAKEVRDTIKNLRDAALTSTTAETAGTGQFSPVIQRNQLSEKATAAISGTVEKMVKHVLDKSYTPADVCLSHLISLQDKIEKELAETRKFVSQVKAEKLSRYKQAANFFEDIEPDNLQTVPNIQNVLATLEEKVKQATNNTQAAKQAIEEIQQHVKKIRNIQEIKGICMDVVKASIQPNSTPYAPINLTATPGDTKIMLSWTTPSDGGAAIRSYEYQKSNDGGQSWSLDWTPIPGSGATTTSHTIKKLTNDTEYTFKVRARNSVGAGKVSNSVSSTPKNDC